MGAASLLLGSTDAGGGNDSYCLALLRPVYANGIWVIGDASLFNRPVTNSGLTVGQGPWSNDNGGIIDPTYDALCYTAGSSTLAAPSVFDFDLRVMVSERPTVNKVVARIGATTIEYPGCCFYYGPGATNKIKFLFTSRTSVSQQNAIFSGDFNYNDGMWHHLRVKKVAVSSSWKFAFYVDGIRVGDTVAHTPDFGAVPSLILGSEKAVSGWPQGAVSRLAEVRVSNIVRWRNNFLPPLSPYA